MKHTLLAVLLLFSSALAFAQSEEPEYKPVVIHYNANWQVTKPEAAVVKRLAYLPANMKDIHNLEAPTFQHAITDYYADNSVMARGYYNAQGKKWGKWLFYHPNGQLDCEGSFNEDAPTGNWKFWTPAGEPIMDITVEEESVRVHSLWGASGEQLVKDGHGVYKAPFPSVATKGVSMLEGEFVDGYKTGWWRLTDPSGKMELEQMYDSKGRFLSGTKYEKGKPAISESDKMKLIALPDYLLLAEAWGVDHKYYEPKFPVIAELLNFKTIKVDVAPTKDRPADHYYYVVQQRSSGLADTALYGVPLIEPVFSGELQQYIYRNFRMPRSLYNSPISGLLVVRFNVTEAGKIGDAEVIRSVHPKIDEEAIRFVNSMPAWKPATRLGKPVATSMTLPIRFYSGSMSMDSRQYMPKQYSNMFLW
ncbi:energy transducer TonB [Pontibacter virosus]|uniref:TonB family protein n=1 Tax=Pontibacter virosus TaxID=1765052 RepID=A0A2U1B5X9_9BACT|nr:energy transducer TonB [Pontibacter virosus]PVY44011.1 TonB family protein [Pontibacter virosus]